MNSKPAQTVPLAATDTSGRNLPPEAPLQMPRHAVDEPAARRRDHPGFRARLETFCARLYTSLLTIAISGYGIGEMHAVLSAGSITPLQWGFLVLFAINFAWIAFSFAQASLGFLCGLFAWLAPDPPEAGEIPFRTAILVPVYNEEPRRVAAAVRAMRAGLREQLPGKFDFFILSDSNRAAAWLDEEAVFHQALLTGDEDCAIYYRHRGDNSERKAGNIADWVQRWGGHYEAMIILDADSIISPETLISMTRRLTADPGLGLIQTLPCIVRGTSLYGRLQQFANQCYGPIYARGLAAWHGNASNYWGHNAIIRTAAFAGACGLPLLPGDPPFGGHVLSHDFIEAAMLRRAGWGVRFDCDLQHSYEEAPPSLIDVATRDRRWCQGNLQHSRFLFARGLSLPTRIHLFCGIMSYLSALLWLGLVLLGLAIALQASLVRPEYFTEPALFPTWPVFDAERARWLFGVSMAVLLAPKWFGATLLMLQPRRLMRFGGPVLLPFSLLFEIVLSALYAPVLMLHQTRVVWQIVSGRDAGWSPQSRDDGAQDLGTVLRAHWIHSLIGVVLSAIAWLLNPELFFWLLPITAGLLLAVPLSWLSGGSGRGNCLAVTGLLRSPGERRPCEVLQRLERELERPTPPPATGGVLDYLSAHPALCAWHLAQLPLPAAHDGVPLFHSASVTAQWKARHARGISQLEEWLTPAELMALVGNRDTLKAALRIRPD